MLVFSLVNVVVVIDTCEFDGLCLCLSWRCRMVHSVYLICRRLIAGNGSETLVFAGIGKFESRELISLSCLIEIPTDGQDVNEFVMSRVHQYKGMVRS